MVSKTEKNRPNGVVTGASGSLGSAIAVRLAREGYNIVVGYRSDKEGALSTAAQVRAAGAAALPVSGDLSTAEGVGAFFRQVRTQWGRVSVLVNNAGITEPEPPSETTVERWDRMIQINLSSVFYCCKAVMNDMIDVREGSIVNITSICGKNGGLKAGVHYSAAKAGVHGLTKGLADHLAQYGVRVNAVAPAMIDSKMIRWRSPELMQKTIEAIPLGRIGRPEEVAAAVSYLVSQKGGFVTGTVIDVNGGLYMD